MATILAEFGFALTLQIQPTMCFAMRGLWMKIGAQQTDTEFMHISQTIQPTAAFCISAVVYAMR